MKKKKEIVSTNYESGMKDLRSETQRILREFIRADQFVGEAHSVAYDNTYVYVGRDVLRREFTLATSPVLLASRFDPESDSYFDEDATFVLLLRLDELEAERHPGAAMGGVGEEERHTDNWTPLAPATSKHPAFAGVEYDVLGAFSLAGSEESRGALHLNYAAVDNFNPNQHFKVYKTNDEALVQIAACIGKRLIENLAEEPRDATHGLS